MEKKKVFLEGSEIDWSDDVGEGFSDELYREKLILSVDLGDGRRETLVVNEDDDVEFVAIEFCQKNMLGPRAKIAICEEVEKYLKNPTVFGLGNEIKNSEEKKKTNKKGNIGEELYMKGVIMRLKKEHQSKKERDIRDAEIKKLTFRPKVNSPARRNRLPEEILLEKGRKSKERLLQKRSAQEISVVSGCTFSPEVNKNSAKMKKSEVRSPFRYKFLYQDAEHIREKILEKSEQL